MADEYTKLRMGVGGRIQLNQDPVVGVIEETISKKPETISKKPSSQNINGGGAMRYHGQGKKGRRDQNRGGPRQIF